jgi:hypothetical protein
MSSEMYEKVPPFRKADVQESCNKTLETDKSLCIRCARNCVYISILVLLVFLGCIKFTNFLVQETNVLQNRQLDIFLNRVLNISLSVANAKLNHTFT